MAVGAYMGAVIKTDVQKKQAVQEFKREDPKEQIARWVSRRLPVTGKGQREPR